ncbi:MAG: BrnT family toxin [Acidobacteria bacterium]|nr:BrnT family toxin [Acidobacteriota bacterium]
MEFEWDLAKAARNLTKHGIAFAEAATVFDDPLPATPTRKPTEPRTRPVPRRIEPVTPLVTRP